MFGYLGKLFVMFLSAAVALGVLGWLQTKRDVKKGYASPAQKEDPFLSEEEVENVNDLNAPFDRARYMDRDGR